MPRTTVGLFKNPIEVEAAVKEIQAMGFPRQEIRVVDEPKTFEVTGVMSFARLDYEVELRRELSRIGASKMEVEDYVEGLRNGGALVLVTGFDGKVDAAAEVMNRHGAVEVEETSGPEPELPGVPHPSGAIRSEETVLAGRVRQPGSGAAVFIW